MRPPARSIHDGTSNEPLTARELAKCSRFARNCPGMGARGCIPALWPRKAIRKQPGSGVGGAVHHAGEGGGRVASNTNTRRPQPRCPSARKRRPSALGIGQRKLWELTHQVRPDPVRSRRLLCAVPLSPAARWLAEQAAKGGSQ